VHLAPAESDTRDLVATSNQVSGTVSGQIMAPGVGLAVAIDESD